MQYTGTEEMSDIVPLTLCDLPDYHSGLKRNGFVPNELTRLVIEYQQTGSQRTKNKAAECLVPFTRTEAYRVAGTVHDGSIDIDDFYCAGWFGFLTAIEKYDPSKGYQFFSYVKRRIIGAMLDERRKCCPIFKRRKGMEEDVDNQALQEFENQKYRVERSLDETFDISGNGEGSAISLLDYAVSTPSHLETIIAQEDENATWAIVIWALSQLDPRECYVLIHYFLLGRTLNSIGSDFNRSETRILQLKKCALIKINYFIHGTPLPQRIQKGSKIKSVATLQIHRTFWREDNSLTSELRECLVMFDSASHGALFTENVRKFKGAYTWLIDRKFICSVGDIIYKIDRGSLRREIDQRKPALSSREKASGLKAIKYTLELPIWDINGFRWRLNIEKARVLCYALNTVQPVSH